MHNDDNDKKPIAAGHAEDLHPEMQVLVSRRKATSATDESLEARRKAWTIYSLTLAAERPTDLGVRDTVIEHSGLVIPVRIYTPPGAAGKSMPCVVYLHGGGFMLGDLDSSDFIAWGIADQASCIVVSVDYPLSPEHPYPVAFDASYACTEWLYLNGSSVGIDTSRIAIAGDSAGANLAAAVCLAARDRGGPAIVAQALAYPWLTHETAAPSRTKFAQGPGLTTDGLVAYGDAYIGNVATNQRDPYAWPLHAENFADLPPAWVHVAERDPARDDGRRYAAALIGAGVELGFREAPHTIHAFLRARFAGPMAASEFGRFTAFLKHALHD
ncbi:alpha/beta hydrolase [soil metagenome]